MLSFLGMGTKKRNTRAGISVKHRSLTRWCCSKFYLKRTESTYSNVFLQERTGPSILLLQTAEGQREVHSGKLWGNSADVKSQCNPPQLGIRGTWMEWWTAPPCCVSGCQLVPMQVTEGQRVTESQVAHVENEIEVRAANIVSWCVVVLVPQTVHSRILVPQTIYVVWWTAYSIFVPCGCKKIVT